MESWRGNEVRGPLLDRVLAAAKVMVAGMGEYLEGKLLLRQGWDDAVSVDVLEVLCNQREVIVSKPACG